MLFRSQVEEVGHVEQGLGEGRGGRTGRVPPLVGPANLANHNPSGERSGRFRARREMSDSGENNTDLGKLQSSQFSFTPIPLALIGRPRQG